MKKISYMTFAFIMLVEIIIFLLQPIPVKVFDNGKEKSGSGLSGFLSDKDLVNDYEAQRNSYIKFTIVLGTTAVIGLFVSKSLPEKRKIK